MRQEQRENVGAGTRAMVSSCKCKLFFMALCVIALFSGNLQGDKAMVMGRIRIGVTAAAELRSIEVQVGAQYTATCVALAVTTRQNKQHATRSCCVIGSDLELAASNDEARFAGTLRPSGRRYGDLDAGASPQNG
jgi:hypothetical protein